MSVTVSRLAVLALLLVACGVLALRIEDNLSPLPAPIAMLDNELAPPQGAPAGGALADVAPPPFERYAAVLDRPLFEPDRRARAEEVEASPSETGPKLLDATLSGIIHSGARSVALLRARGEGAGRAVPLGGTFRGWTLTRIAPDSVDLTRGSETVTLGIDYRRRGEGTRSNSGQ